MQLTRSTIQGYQFLSPEKRDSTMNLFSGISYNYRGLKLGLRTPGLLVLGLVRFFVVVALTIVAAGMVLVYYQEIMAMVWARPESVWIAWLWHLLSWLLALLLLAGAALVSFLVSQILFAVLIMDRMSVITERLVSGAERQGRSMPHFSYFLYLLRQEIPRTIIPVAIAMVLMVLGWLTPLSPVLTVLSSIAAGIFLAWDNTDLVPARRLEPFADRFRFLTKHLSFHLGFGLWFLIPVVNILFLSFAPVGATLFYIEKVDGRRASEKDR
jgi:CysZ protein